MPLSGFGSSGLSSFTTLDDIHSSHRSPAEASPENFQLYSWESFEPVGGLLPQPEWTSWEHTVEYCAFAYQQYIVISSLRPQFRYLGDVAIPYATGALWHRRQLFVATPTTIECVFVDAGVTTVDIETRKRKEELKMREAHARAIAEHGELALITVEGRQTSLQERINLRPPMLQVCLFVVPAHFFTRDGVLWLVDRANRLGREHHDNLAQFMLGMGYATEALHLPGFQENNDLKRALQCLLTMSNSRDIGQDGTGLGLNDILNLTAKKENIVEAVHGIVKFAKEFLKLIDAADATEQADIACEALKKLAAAGSVKGALQGHELRGLALRLANHGELTRLGVYF